MRSVLRLVLVAVLSAMVGFAAGFITYDAKAVVTANVVFGGFNQPTGEGCANALVATGHIGAREQIVLPGYPARLEPWIDGGMAGSTAKGLPGGIEAVNRLRAEGKRVELHGCSQGSDVAIAVAHAVGCGNVVTVTHGSPHHAMGVFHGDIPQSPLIEPFLQMWAGLPTDRVPCAGTHAFYNEGDVWSNWVPNQWDIIQLPHQAYDTFILDAHWVQPLGGQRCGFTDRFSVINHVYDDGNPFTRNGC